MQLNEKTLSVLSNFATIQDNIVIEESDKISTVAEIKNILATAKLDQSFPKRFGIYDLPIFLAVLDLVDTPKLEFHDKHLIVSDSVGLSRVKFFYSDESNLTVPPKTIKMPEANVTFKLTGDTLNNIRKASSTLGYNKVVITPSNGGLRLSVTDSTDKTSNSYSVDIPGEADSENFSFVLNVDNLKVIPGDYDVEVSSRLLSKFTNTNLDVEYFIALEKSSTYGE
jgi:hypothetical protein